MASQGIAKILRLGVGLTLLAAAPAAATDRSATQTQPAASPIKNDTGKRVCRSVVPTGSRFSQRVCRTAEEWQKDSDDAQRHMQESNSMIRENGCGFDCGR